MKRFASSDNGPGSAVMRLWRMLALKKEGNVDYYALLSKQSTVAEGFESTG